MRYSLQFFSNDTVHVTTGVWWHPKRNTRSRCQEGKPAERWFWFEADLLLCFHEIDIDWLVTNQDHDFSRKTGMMRRMVSGLPRPWPILNTRVHGSQRYEMFLWVIFLDCIEKFSWSGMFCRKLRIPTTRGSGRHQWLITQVRNHYFLSKA